MVFEVDGPAEAAELFRQLKDHRAQPKEQNAPVPPPTPPQKRAQPPVGREFVFRRSSLAPNPDRQPVFAEWAPSATLGMLMAIRNSSQHGPSSDEMMRAMGASDGKALGGRTAQANRLLDHLGFDVDDVYTSTKDSKQRYWRAGPRIDDAIRTVKQQFSSRQLTMMEGGFDDVDR